MNYEMQCTPYCWRHWWAALLCDSLELHFVQTGLSVVWKWIVMVDRSSES